MITITLTDEDALEYLSLRDKYENVCVEATTPTVEPIVETPTVSPRLEADAKKFSDIVSTPKEEPTTTNDLASEWRTLVDSGVPSDLSRSAWTKKDIEVLRISVGKTSPHYYSVDTLSTYLGRTPAAIRSATNRLGFRIVGGMIRYGK